MKLAKLSFIIGLFFITSCLKEDEPMDFLSVIELYGNWYSVHDVQAQVDSPVTELLGVSVDQYIIYFGPKGIGSALGVRKETSKLAFIDDSNFIFPFEVVESNFSRFKIALEDSVTTNLDTTLNFYLKESLALVYFDDQEAQVLVGRFGSFLAILQPLQ